MLEAIHAPEDADAARQKPAAVIEKLKGMKLAKAAEMVAGAFEETLACCRFPQEHWRRTRVLRAFPDGNSCLKLAAAG